jgi:membrane-bound lytic murein transglycosylase A
MTLSPFRTLAGAGLALCMIAAVATPAQSHSVLHFRHVKMQALSFDALQGWKKDNLATAFQAYLKSCGAIRHVSKSTRRRRPFYSGLYNACMNAFNMGTADRQSARKFFEANFKPVRITANQTIGYYSGTGGFYTGYWELQVKGSRKKTDEFTVPLYRTPRSGRLRHLDRSSIAAGALKGKGLVICWIKDPIDAFFAEIQGSIRVKLDDGRLLRLNYDSSNGRHYTPVGKILIDRGVYTPQEMSMAKIREYMTAHPKEGRALRMENHSFVFFKETQLKADQEPVGAEGVPLTAGRSLAVDYKHHVYGTPIWIDARFPLKSTAPEDKFQHLMFAQDTGGAIRGVARADIYFGHREGIGLIAGRIKQFGKFVMLVPKDLAVETSKPGGVPLPPARPKAIAVQEAMAGGHDAGSAALSAKAIKLAPVPNSMPLPKPRP